MAGQRVTQTPAEVLYTAAASQWVTQAPVEVLYTAAASQWVTQVVLEVLYDPTPVPDVVSGSASGASQFGLAVGIGL